MDAAKRRDGKEGDEDAIAPMGASTLVDKSLPPPCSDAAADATSPQFAGHEGPRQASTRAIAWRVFQLRVVTGTPNTRSNVPRMLMTFMRRR